MTYKLLARLYDFKNSTEIDLFPVFVDEIFSFISFRDNLTRHDGSLGTANSFDWWSYISAGPMPRPKMHESPYKDFQAAVKKFNDELAFFLRKITESVNEYLALFKLNVRFSFRYEPVVYDAFEPGSTTKRTRKTFPGQILISIRATDERLPENRQAILRPQSHLNEAKLTTIALAIRFAVFDEKLQAVTGGTNAPKLLILDDLLLSLDMSNRDCVLDIILKRFTDTQIIILTHDKYFFSLTKHKIGEVTGNEWKFYEIFASEKDGIPQPLVSEAKTYLENAEKYLRLHEYEIAGNFLRKEAEAFCREFLPKRRQRTKECADFDLNGLINQCREFAIEAGLAPLLFDRLQGHRKFVLNATSHDSYDVPKYRSEIEACLETLKSLRKIKFKTILQPKAELAFEVTTLDGSDVYRFEITIWDDLRLLKAEGSDSVLCKVHVNYTVAKNGAKGGLQHGIESIASMYSKCYEKSDKTLSSDFWDEVILVENGQKLSTIREY